MSGGVVYSGGPAPWVRANRRNVARSVADFVNGMSLVDAIEKLEKDTGQPILFKPNELSSSGSGAQGTGGTSWMRPEPASKAYIRALTRRMRRDLRRAKCAGGKGSNDGGADGELIFFIQFQFSSPYPMNNRIALGFVVIRFYYLFHISFVCTPGDNNGDESDDDEEQYEGMTPEEVLKLEVHKERERLARRQQDQGPSSSLSGRDFYAEGRYDVVGGRGPTVAEIFRQLVAANEANRNQDGEQEEDDDPLNNELIAAATSFRTYAVQICSKFLFYTFP